MKDVVLHLPGGCVSHWRNHSIDDAIVLFLGAAIPGDIWHYPGTSPGAPSPRHYARNAWKGPSESGSGPAPKPMSRVLPVRQVASATGLSPSRDPREIPGGNCQRRRPNRPDEPRQEAAPSRGLPDLLTRWPSSSRCREWLERLDRGELVVVNLRPETDPETEYVAFDRPRVLRVLSHITADLLAGYPQIADEEQAKVEDPEAPPPATAIRSPTRHHSG